MVYTVSTSLGGGFRAGLWATLGCTIATVLHLVVALAGLAAILPTSALLFQTIKFAGVAYLLWLAWAMLRSSGGMSIEALAQNPPRRVVWRDIVLDILNPKLPLFFVAFLPQFLPATAGSSLSPMIELGLGFTGVTALTFVLYAGIAASGRQAILGNPSLLVWLRRAFATAFAALGARLAVESA